MRESDTDQVRRALLALAPLLAVAGPAVAQDATRMQQQNFRVALENEHLRVLEYISRPNMGVCGSGRHSHPAHLTVLLSSGKVREKLADGKVLMHDNMPLGTVFWSEAVTHETENIGGSDLRSLIVELKNSKA